MAKSSASRRLSYTTTLTSVIFIIFVVTVCSAELPTELTEIFHKYNITVWTVDGDDTFRFFDEIGGQVLCEVLPRNSPQSTTKPLFPDPTLGTILNAVGELDHRTWDVGCRGRVLSLATGSGNSKCPDNTTIDDNGRCRPIAE